MARTRRAVAQINVRLSDDERALLKAAIERAEKAASLVPGTLTPSAYVRSVLLAHLAKTEPKGK